MISRLSNQERLDRRRNYAGPVFLKEGFRPFFLLGGLWAALAAPLWVGVWAGYIAYGGTFDPLYWHIHEMLFGFVVAAVAGFLLTTVPNWTGRLPVRGTPLALLVLLWIAGRIAMWWGDALGAEVTAVIDLSFLSALLICIATEIFSGRNWRNAPVLVVLALLLTANVLFHIDAAGYAVTGDVAIRLSIGAMVMMIGLIGGRVIPSFTRNWFAAQQGAETAGPQIAKPMTCFDIVALVLLAFTLAAWIILDSRPDIGVALIVVGVLNFWRLCRWKGWRTVAEPLVLILHAGYFWLAVGLVLLGASMIGALAEGGIPVSESAALHILTIGAMGTMILAVQTRAILGHTGRTLTAGKGTCTIYGLVTLAVLLRVWFEFDGTTTLIWVSAGAWTLGFTLFAVIYGPLVVMPKHVDITEG